MKRHLVAVTVSIALIAASAGRAQAPVAGDDKKLLALIKEVQAQQAQIAENQGKIETKLSEIAENIRVARIFSGRSD